MRLISLYRRQILILFFLNLVSSSFFLAAPYLSKLFMDNAFLKRDLAVFLNLSLLGAAVFLFSTSVKAVGDIIKNRIAIKLRLNLANKFMRKFYSFDLSFFQAKSAGENVWRLSDSEGVSNFILEQCPHILVDIFKLPVILALSLWLNPGMTLFLLILSPLFLLHSVYLQKKLKAIYEEMWKYSAKLSKEIYEAFAKILIIKALGLETYQRRQYLNSLIGNIRWRIRSFRWAIISSLTSSFLSKAIYGLLSLYGGWLIIKGRMSIGSYTAAMLYLTQLGGLVQSLGNRFEYFSRERVSLEKFFEIMDSQPKIKDLPGAKVLESIKGEITFNNVYFGYQDQKPIFKKINFIIPASSWVAIAGSSGCGKTTLINLILHLYEPQEGEILLDGQNLKTIKIRSLREKIAPVTQQPLLFDFSIRENIAYGLRHITSFQVIEAAKAAYVHDFIEQLPEGYDTLIGEDACRLSQGLKQRIALARAIIRNPDLLILDEATSSVDSLTEEKIFRALRERRAGLSTIVISHRLFSIKDADRIYYLREDGMIEEGAHQELLAHSQFYREFFQNQLAQQPNASVLATPELPTR